MDILVKVIPDCVVASIFPKKCLTRPNKIFHWLLTSQFYISRVSHSQLSNNPRLENKNAQYPMFLSCSMFMHSLILKTVNIISFLTVLGPGSLHPIFRIIQNLIMLSQAFWAHIQYIHTYTCSLCLSTQVIVLSLKRVFCLKSWK